MLPILIGAAIGGGLNMWSQGNQRRALNDRISGLVAQYREAMLDTQDVEERKRGVNAYYNASVANTLNKTAYQTRGVLNKGGVRAAAISGTEGQRAQALSNVQNYADSYNLDILNKISSLDMSKANGDAVGDFAGGAVQGGMAAANISKLMELDNPLVSRETSSNTEGSGYTSSTFNNTYADDTSGMSFSKGLGVSVPTFTEPSVFEKVFALTTPYGVKDESKSKPKKSTSKNVTTETNNSYWDPFGNTTGQTRLMNWAF
jgi:hypothetical protein